MTKLITIQLKSITAAPTMPSTAVHSPLSRTFHRTWISSAKITKVFSANTSFGSQPHGRPQLWSAQIAPMTMPAHSMMKLSSVSSMVTPSRIVPSEGRCDAPPADALPRTTVEGTAQAALAALGVEWPSSPLNTSFLLALVACAAVYVFLWHTRAGYQLRAVGASPGAAAYAGIRPQSQVVRAMAISGALAGMVGMNEVAGVSGKLVLEFVSGAGFTGIAVALMGRNHPLGIVVSSLLFGALFQGGAEVAFDVPGFSRDMVVMLQGFVVLFSGAMAYVIAPPLAWTLRVAGLTRTRHG